MAQNDSFIREVDEQIRQDRARDLWSKYGKFIVAAAVLIVLATAASVIWNQYRENQIAAAGDAYIDALDLAERDPPETAIEALDEIAQNGSGAYPALAQLRIAAERLESGDKQAAMEGFEAVADNAETPDAFREIARLRAGLIAVDLEDYASVETRLSELAGPGRAFRHSAREALAIAAIKAEDYQKAYEWIEPVVNDSTAPQGVRQRAQTMVDYLAGRGIPAAG